MKPIKLTDEMLNKMKDELIAQIVEKFNEAALKKDAVDKLMKCRMSDGQFSFKKEFKFEKKFEYKNDGRRVLIRITPDAYAKMLTVIMTNTDEVGWHGVSERISETEFLVKDILVYPQTVTAVTVDTDDEEYAKWLIDLDKIDENIFPNLHFHGHSHVNMGCSPSTTDMGHREKIVAQLGDDDYYIFMIWNKRLEWTASVYDVGSNILYESSDVDVMVQFADGKTAGDVLDEVTENVSKRVYAAQKGSSPVYPVYNQQNDTKKNEPKEKVKHWWEEEDEKGKGGQGVGDGSEGFPYERNFYGLPVGGYYDY